MTLDAPGHRCSTISSSARAARKRDGRSTLRHLRVRPTLPVTLVSWAAQCGGMGGSAGHQRRNVVFGGVIATLQKGVEAGQIGQRDGA